MITNRRSVVRPARFAPLATVSFALLIAAAVAFAQSAPVNGPRQIDPRWHAIVGATLTPAPGETIENATIVFRDGVITSVAPNARPPRGARVWDAQGRHVYAGFIDAHVPVDAPKPDPKLAGSHWNEKVAPQRSPLDGDALDDKTREELRKMGFAAAAIAPKDGVFRGQVAVVALDEPAPTGDDIDSTVLAPTVFHEVAFETAGFRSRGYPASQMGAIALVRQTLSDAAWHVEALNAARRNPAGTEPVTPSDALLALSADFPLLFNTDDELEILRADKIAREFDREAAIVGSGTEFRRLDAVSEASRPIILPLTYPKKPKVATRSDLAAAELRALMTWEQAPTNAHRLDQAGLTVALTTDKLKKRGDFHENLRLAIEHGLSEERALAMLTTSPAQILGLEDRLGKVEPGMLANLIVADGPIFEKKSTILDVWVSGERFQINETPPTEFEGEWAVEFPGAPDRSGTLKVDVADSGKVSVKLESEDEDAIKARSVVVRESRLNYVVDMPEGGSVVSSAILEGDTLHGTITTPEGDMYNWLARRAEADDAGEDEEKKKEDEPSRRAQGVPDELPTPLSAFGLMEEPEVVNAVFTNATIWTSGPDGVIEHGAIWVRDGKIEWVGPASRLPATPGAERVDVDGKHITPGLIDCHSHTGISGGVNEGTQAVTSEVRIFDVINPDDIDWYRQLAGGLTAVNQLHGSANPIGGQNSVVKIRWGAEHPDDYRIEDASSGIKFALGENVKQSNWGNQFTNRYPQTRMGVETIIRDRFTAAREYAEQMDAYEGMSAPERRQSMPERRDLELEALAEILAGERLIHCHSYRQDEILMLCRVAADFGFTIGTFQHVLEGYKVAEAIREHSLGGSSFSDWWAYKFEVYDAIPENGAIMHEAGVVVSFNSDSDELARRMNAEAAKAVKYGGVDPSEALKFVTLNPAKQLRIDDRVGSLEKGKDADFVIWSGSPLSSLARCEATYVDGREFFSLERDAELRRRAEAERNRIIQKVLSLDRPKAGDVASAEGRQDEVVPDDAVPEQNPRQPGSMIERMRADAMREHFIDLWRAGVDPDSVRCGVCGCETGAALLIR